MLLLLWLIITHLTAILYIASKVNRIDITKAYVVKYEINIIRIIQYTMTFSIIKEGLSCQVRLLLHKTAQSSKIHPLATSK